MAKSFGEGVNDLYVGRSAKPPILVETHGVIVDMDSSAASEVPSIA